MEVKTKPPLGVVRPNPNVIFRRLGAEIVLFHLDTDRFYELNGTAARFWELLCAGNNTTRVHELMIEEFAVDPGELSDEAQAFVASLKKEDLVSVDE